MTSSTSNQIGFTFEPPRPIAADAFRLETNVAVSAGAGAGKTFRLISLALHALLGARAGKAPVPPHKLVLLTFTQKAAAEMRERLVARLANIRREVDPADDLRTSFAALGQPFPDSSFLQRLESTVESAFIGTFHAYCGNLLNRFASDAESTPRLQLLDEEEASARLQLTVETALLRALDQKNPHLTQLIEVFHFGAPDRPGLAALLTSVLKRMREEGLFAFDVREPDFWRQAFETQRARLRSLLNEQLANYQGKSRDKLQTLSERLSHLSLEQIPDHWNELASLTSYFKGELQPIRDFIRKIDKPSESPDSVLLFTAQTAKMAPFEAAIAAFLTDAAQHHQDQLAADFVTDYAQIMLSARDLLAFNRSARSRAQQGCEVLLIDEFQDSNRLQLEVVALLAEQRSPGPREIPSPAAASTQAILALPFEPAMLSIVGDVKQAIYDFRGADVSLFGKLANAIETQGGSRAFLTHSQRTSPELLLSLNALSAHALSRRSTVSEAPMAFEVHYRPDQDDLVAVRPPAQLSSALVQLHDQSEFAGTAALRQADARQSARYLAWALSTESTQVIDRATKLARRIHAGDCAMLFSRMTHVDTYRAALAELGVPHFVLRGRGFLETQEVSDVAALLALLSDESDSISLAAVLRGPWVLLSDAALLSLAQASVGRGLTLSNTLTLPIEKLPFPISSEEQRRLGHFRRAFGHLQAMRPQLSIQQLLRLAFELFDYRLFLSTCDDAPQAQSNLERLLELAAARDASRKRLSEFALELLGLAAAADLDQQGEVAFSSQSQRVTLSTVHQAKGLEWPLVILPELFASPRNDSSGLAFDRDFGLALRPFDSPEGTRVSLQSKHIDDVKRRRRRAEHQRLFYVACTRARDRLVFGLQGGGSDSWSAGLSVCPWPEEATPEHVDGSALPLPVRAIDNFDQVRELELAAKRVRNRVPVDDQANLTVEQLADFESCPFRFFRKHLAFEAEPDGLPSVSLSQWRLCIEKLWPAAPGENRLEINFSVPYHMALPRPDGRADLMLEGALEAALVPPRSNTGDQPAIALASSQGGPDELHSGSAIFRLRCAGLAMQRLLGLSTPVELQLLDCSSSNAQLISASPDDVSFEATIRLVASKLKDALASHEFHQQPFERCRSLKCGFITRCHAGDARLKLLD